MPGYRLENILSMCGQSVFLHGGSAAVPDCRGKESWKKSSGKFGEMKSIFVPSHSHTLTAQCWQVIIVTLLSNKSITFPKYFAS